MEEKKEEILEAARRVLIAEGSGGFSVRKVAGEAGISLGNLQYYFPSRIALLEGLLAADIAAYSGAYEKMLRTDRTSEGGPSGKVHLESFLRGALAKARAAEEVAVFRALFSFTEPEVLRLIEGYYREIAELLARGLAAITGQSPDARQVREATAILLPYLDGYAVTAPFLPLAGEETANLIGELAWRVLSRGTGEEQ